MPATQQACEVCDTTFYATRSDSLYCSAACRQRAYRSRHETPIRDVTAVDHVTVTAAPSPVPCGDGWLIERVASYTSYADRLALAEALPALTASRTKARAAAILRAHQDDGGLTISAYVGKVADISGDPLTVELPASIVPGDAVLMAADLEAAIPRLVELIALLRGREMEPEQSESPAVRASWPDADNLGPSGYLGRAAVNRRLSEQH